MEYLFGVIWRTETSSVFSDIIPHLVRHMDTIKIKCQEHICLKLTAEKDINNCVQWSHKCLEAARNHIFFTFDILKTSLNSLSVINSAFCNSILSPK